MSFAKKNFSASNSSVSSTVSSLTSGAKPAFLEVIDPINRTGKITIPMEHIQETRGMNESTRPKDAKDLSLCLLFQKGKCNAGSRCHQIHADSEFVSKLRNQASSGSACCALHGDFNSTSYLTAGLTVEVMNNGSCTKYALSAFAKTSAMDSLIANATSHFSKTIRLNSNKICRLHSQSRCKFGKDCKNVHMCPNAKPIIPSEIPAPLAGFSRPSSDEKKSTPLGSAHLNTASRKMKSTPALDVSKSELSAASSLGPMTNASASIPNTPCDCAKSIRSSSVESNSNNGLSGLATPEEGSTPKEKTLGSLFNRCSTPPHAPSIVARPLFACDTDAVYTPKKKAIAPVAAIAPAPAAASDLWSTPLKTVATNDDGFDATAMSLAVSQELGSLRFVPLF